MKNFVLAAVVMLFLVSCSGSNDIISEKKMVKVLADIHLTDGVLDNYRYTMNRYQNPDSLYLYKVAFERNDVTREEFIRSLQYYSQYPKRLDRIYTEVINRLSALRQETQDNLEKEMKKKGGKSSAPDSLKRTMPR